MSRTLTPSSTWHSTEVVCFFFLLLEMLIVPIKMKTLNMQRLSSERGVLTQWSNQAGCWSSRGVMGLFYTTVTHQNSSFSRKIPALPYSKETWDEDGRFQRKNKTTKIKWTIFLPTGSQYAWWVVCLFFFLWVSTSTACCRWECLSSEDLFVCAVFLCVCVCPCLVQAVSTLLLSSSALSLVQKLTLQPHGSSVTRVVDWSVSTLRILPHIQHGHVPVICSVLLWFLFFSRTC